MSAQKKVEKMIDKYEIDELLGDDSIDMQPFAEAVLENLGNENDDAYELFEKAMEASMGALEIDEDEYDLLFNRCAFLMYSGLIKDEDGDFADLYTGVEGQCLVLGCITFIDELEEDDDCDLGFALNFRNYLKDLIEAIWRLNGDAEMAGELLWQAVGIADIYAEAEEFEEVLNTAHAALTLFDEDMNEECEGMREAVGLLWYYMGEGEEDDETAAEYYRTAIETLDDPSVLDDPVDEDTPDLLEELKNDWLDD